MLLQNHLPPCSQSCNLTLHLYCLELPPSTRGLCLGRYIANLRRLVNFDTSLSFRLWGHHRSPVLHRKTNNNTITYISKLFVIRPMVIGKLYTIQLRSISFKLHFCYVFIWKSILIRHTLVGDWCTRVRDWYYLCRGLIPSLRDQYC